MKRNHYMIKNYNQEIEFTQEFEIHAEKLHLHEKKVLNS